ncbi:MAG: metal-dependent hydrolase [Nanoarchaeota archaeon]|nr:metal-dependent hydrolase [Nanoarchaeota archaeon]MBU4241792.1 metal-dependent hydrolase [Nanoarchaeota archaeon]MBU4352060.1 metal-dependent hydrolase [Nanoarchaeota archaeon]
MPNGAMHILVGLISANVVRDFVVKKKFSLFFVLVAAFGSVLPDVDIALYWLLNVFREVPLSLVHRQFTHTLLLPLLLLLIAFIFIKKEKVFLFFSMLSLGAFTHLVLDSLFIGTIIPFYPISGIYFGLNLVPDTQMAQTVVLVIEGVLLLGWLSYLYYRHKVKDFI